MINYLKNKHNSRLVFDPTYSDIDKRDFPMFDWTEFYDDANVAMPTDMPKPLGKDIDLRMLVDSDHAGRQTDPTILDRLPYILQHGPY